MQRYAESAPKHLLAVALAALAAIAPMTVIDVRAAAAGDAALDRLPRPTPPPNYAVPKPDSVQGRVVVDTNGNGRADPGETGIAAVSVSDGFAVVKTGPDGTYRLRPSPLAVFISVTRPPCHDVVGSWYKPLQATTDFLLTPASRSEDEYTFVQVTDTHVSANPAALAGLSRFVQEVNAMRPLPRFVFNSGDLIDLDKTLDTAPAVGHDYFRRYTGIMNHLQMPYYNVAGDHTDAGYRLDLFPRGDPRCGKAMYYEYLGPNFFSFEYGQVHFVSVDFVYHLGQRQIQGREYPTNGVMPIHTAWLNDDLAQRSPGTFAITASESDLTPSCPGFADLAARHDIRLQLTGDDHIVAENSSGVPYRTGGALSGCWWNPKCEGLCPDLSPQGYMLYRVSGARIDGFYKGLGQRIAIVSPRLGAAWQGRVSVRAHLVQPQPRETLQYSLDDEAWQEMPAVERPFYRAVHEAVLDTAPRVDGLATLRVRSSVTGETRDCVGVIANGRTPAPTPADASLTFAVGLAAQARNAPAAGVDVVFNGKVIGTLAGGARKSYTFSVPQALLTKANTLRFVFAQHDDGMALGSPVLSYCGQAIEDPRASAVRRVKTAHWGADAAGWGGFIVGDGGLRETPFCRRQDGFCFVLAAP